MKTLLNKILVLILPAVLLWGCKKDSELTILGNTTPSTLSASSAAVVLTKPDIAKTAVTFSFTNPDFGFNAAINNTLQIATAGSGFASPQEFSFSAGVNSKSFTVLDFNSLLLKMNLPTGTASSIEVRIKSTVSSKVKEVYSNVLPMSVTPFAIIEYLYTAGDYQGWDPSKADTLTSATGNGVYTGIIQFNSVSNFKILKQKNWGQAAGEQFAAGVSAGSVVADPPPGFGTPFASPANNVNYPSDNWLVTVNLNTNTIAYELETWGITGSATPKGWPSGDQVNNDTVMKYSNKDKKWYLTVSLTVGDMQFRRNHSWTGQIGINGTNNNIPITSAGTYKISLEPVSKTYTIVKQ